MNLREFINYLVIFLYFAFSIIVALFLIIESGLCLFHFGRGIMPDVIEILSLAIISIAGGVIGLIWYISDMKEL